MSAYHLYGNQVIPRKIQMEQLISILPFPDFTKRTRIFCTICWITCARLHVERNGQIYWYFVTDTTQSHSRFRAKKITVHVPYDRKIFIESSIKMVSAQCLLLFLLHTYISVCLHLDNLIALSANY